MTQTTQRPPLAIGGNEGYHNLNYDLSIQRLEKSSIYRDLSTICIVPTRGVIDYRVVQSFMGLMAPMNQKFMRIFIPCMEVGAAYEEGVAMVLNHPDLSKWQYILTIEEDNMPPADGLLKLYESMIEYDVVGGLYWTKGEGGMPMCYGNPKVIPLAFNPQLPAPDAVTPCNGLGMGFTLFKLEVFRKVARPWFKTEQSLSQGGAQSFTQDLYFAHKAAQQGVKFACDSRVKVGHLDRDSGIIW